jgi:hypothetical protein
MSGVPCGRMGLLQWVRLRLSMVPLRVRLVVAAGQANPTQYRGNRVKCRSGEGRQR